MTPQTPPTDRPLTAGDGNASCPGGWLIKDFADGWYWTPHRIAAVAALTDGHAVHPLVRPATSAASEGEVVFAPVQATPEMSIAFANALEDYITSHGWTTAKQVMGGLPFTPIWSAVCHGAALASPPVSERERELGDYTMALAEVQEFEKHADLAAQVERMATSGRIGSMIEWDAFLQALNAALTAQPAGEGK